jgi:hypothetical protein
MAGLFRRGNSGKVAIGEGSILSIWDIDLTTRMGADDAVQTAARA